jgi:hypothetical protein
LPGSLTASETFFVATKVPVYYCNAAIHYRLVKNRKQHCENSFKKISGKRKKLFFLPTAVYFLGTRLQCGQISYTNFSPAGIHFSAHKIIESSMKQSAVMKNFFDFS